MREEDSGRLSVEPYTVLASLYDLVMEYVDYREWALYIESLLSEHAPEATDVLELGCGTGRFARELAGCRDIRYLGADASPNMIRVARDRDHSSDLDFDVLDFRRFELERRFDVVILLYDGLNYLLEEEDIGKVLSVAQNHLRPGGLFIFDQSTPTNSLNNQNFFEDAGANDIGSFVRQSHYDVDTRLHHTHFDIALPAGTYHEHHVQRAYSIAEVRSLVRESEWTILGVLDGFTHDPASESSERVHWILKAS
jgi:SAM-dependent methyltransferase